MLTFFCFCSKKEKAHEGTILWYSELQEEWLLTFPVTDEYTRRHEREQLEKLRKDVRIVWTARFPSSQT